jgi:hypothetical protein
MSKSVEELIHKLEAVYMPASEAHLQYLWDEERAKAAAALQHAYKRNWTHPSVHLLCGLSSNCGMAKIQATAVRCIA